MNILEKRGSWFSFEGEQLGQGREQVKALMDANPELQEKVLNKVRSVLAEMKQKKQASAAGTTSELAAVSPEEPLATPEK